MKLETLAERLVWARERKEWTQQELADKAGVSQGTIGNLESGARLTARKIASIARALEVDPNWLADNKGPLPGEVDQSAHLERKCETPEEAILLTMYGFANRDERKVIDTVVGEIKKRIGKRANKA